MKVKRYIVTPDKHFPMADMKAISVVCQAIEIIQPDGYIDLGDTGEWESVSHWQWKKKKRPPLEYQLPFVTKEIEEGNKGLDIIAALMVVFSFSSIANVILIPILQYLQDQYNHQAV